MNGPGAARLNLDGAVIDALRVALEALDERATVFRRMLTDTTVYGIADPDRVQRSLQRDEAAYTVLRSTLLPGPASPTDIDISSAR